ncbi:MAG TPA: outer membrane lipoprotein carrier protein LolA [Nitrospirae bacterium]|nr:outer membrane lipoprotein carrier protein LolA [Nitrospirota bacterium]
MRKEKAQSNFHIFFLIFILLIAHYSLFIGVAAASDVDEVVDRVQKKFAGIIDIKGTFVQKSYIKDIEQTQEYSGTFFIKKPSRMMWEYAAPRDEKVIINNLDTWIYKKSQNQVIRTKFTKEAYSQVPIALLGSIENIRADFDITMPEKNALQLAPKHRVGFIKTIVLEITPGEMPVKMFTIFDTYGNIIMIKLRDVKINSGLDDSMFIFKTPPGAEVFDLSQ